MSYQRKSRSIVNFPIFSRLAKYTNKITRSLDQDLNETKANLRRSESQNCEEKPIVQKSNSPTHSFSTTDSDFEGLLDLSNKLSGSSSSLSWSEDYEVEITKKVQSELEKLDKAFQGLGDVPSPHDKEEIEEWKQLFPHIGILGEKTPTNSTENSEVSSESDDETPTFTDTKLENTKSLYVSGFSPNKNALRNKKRPEEQARSFLNSSKSFRTPPHRLKSLEIDNYLKISSLKSPEILTRKQNSQPELLTTRTARQLTDASLDYSSLPFITATPLRSQIRRPPRKISRLLTLPPIPNDHFRSISATPRQASSKSMFVSLNYEKESSARGDEIRLRRDLMKLFDFIPISNR